MSLLKNMTFRILICLVVLLSSSHALDFNLLNQNTDTVLFESTAKLEFVSGTTNSIMGGFSFDPNHNNGIVEGILQVDLRTLKTGIDLRDTHMQKNHLHTDEFPFAYFKFERVLGLPEKLIADSVYNGTVSGEFYLHGIRKDIASDISVSVKSRNDNNITIQVLANFTIKLEDFKIPHPKALFLKVAKEISLEVIFTASSNGEKKEIILPEWLFES